MRVELKKISIVGFKGYKNRVEYDLGNRTVINGNNGLGKSSIGEAIVWALTGCDMWGNEKAATRLVNDKKPKVTEVILDFILDEEPQTIIRRKKSSSNEVYWNENKSSTNEIAKEIFQTKDVFLSIFNPYYFPELAPKDAKQLLSDVLKPVSREEIFQELGDYLKDILLNNGFRVPETFLSDARTDLKEHEENITYLEGVQDGLKPMEILEKKTFDESQLNALKEELEEINKPIDVSKELSMLVVPSMPVLQQYKSNNEDIMKLEYEKETIRKEIDNVDLEEYIQVNSKIQLKQSLLTQYNNIKSKINDIQSKYIKCNNCGTDVDVTQEARVLLEKNLSEILNEGKKVAAEIEEIENKNKEIQLRNENIIKNKKASAEQKIKDIEDSIEKLKAVDEELEKTINLQYEEQMKLYNEKLNEYNKSKEDLLNKAQNSKKEIEEKLVPIKAAIETELKKKQDITNYNAEIDAAIKHNKKLEEERKLNDERIQNSKNKISQLKLAIDACKQYNSIKVKKQADQIKPYLNKVEIQFEEMTKDGELRDKFKINYEGKEFNKLSNAEKIKAGLEIANLLINIQNLHFPIFLDNAESITNIPEIDTQMIIAKVTEDNEIKVEVNK